MPIRYNSNSFRRRNSSNSQLLSARGAPLTATGANRIPERVIAAIFASHKVNGSVGLCFVNCATGEVRLSGLLDSQTYVRTIHKINVYDPVEIIVPKSYLHPSPNKLITILRSNISEDVKILGFERHHFRSEHGMDDISRLAFERDQQYLQTVLSDLPNVLSALAAAIQHMQGVKAVINGLKFDKLRIKFEPSESTMFIDCSSIESLQLISNISDPNGLTFFKLMNHTVTKMGERTLRNNILQPLSDKSSIFERHQAVQELKTNENSLENIRNSLRNCQDLDKLFTVMLLAKNHRSSSLNDQSINQVILVKQAIEISMSISKQLNGSSCFLLNQIRTICQDDDIQKLKQFIDEFINEDCSWASGPLDLKNQKCYAVKSGRNGLLDVSRQLYKAVVDEILSIITSLADEHKLELEHSYNSKRGFYIKVMNHKELNQPIPYEFINRTEKKNFVECTTLDIMKCNSRLDDTVNEILTISNQIIESLVDEISIYLPVLFMVAEALSLLDMIQSFATHASINNYTCPEFSDNIELKASRHPIVETILKGSYIPNDILSINELSRFQVLTGTNMSGKSVYLKQIALISIMAQMGSFVPAERATLKLFHSLKARLCTDLGIVSKGSSFAREMNEMVCIMEEVDEHSLVIIDELGGGSSISDGFSISLALCEELLDTGATVFISTHFQRLSSIMGTRPGVIQSHMRTYINNNGSDIKMEYIISQGLSDSKRYGIKIAEKFFENGVIKRAKEISHILEYPEKMRKIDENELFRAKRFHNLVGVLKYVRANGTLNQELLLKIQNEFIK